MNDGDEEHDDPLGSELRARMTAALRHLVGLVVARDYPGIERLTQGVRFTADWIEDGLEEYGHDVVAPADDAYRDLDVVPVEETSPPAYSVRLPLVSLEDGAPDLELRTTLIDVPDAPLMTVELDDLVVV